ncbi:aromatic amino acid exporter YddG [Roseomonas marmotae]|uniref:EamA family transporter n=1 Tax=Roseomonas marmotae TaxID=2768161 RepID=A0ABS3K7C6_9PROT|nr:EamA family transporter [Roseomonas marmotae]MBO1073379.1 EamA family transporter [Roseomonas marmotae]QTI80421.1 EamA family transporter [Roseomonas marmotae]
MTRHDIAGCGALLLWAFLGVLARMAAGIPPLQLTAMGMAVGGGLALAVVVAQGRLSCLRQGGLAWAHGVGGLFGYHALYFAALALAPAVEANLLNYLWPLLIVLLSAPLLGMRLGMARLAGVALGLSGCALLLGNGAGFPVGALPGFLCAAAGALVWALYSVTARRMSGIPTEAVAGFCLGAALLAGLAHLAFEQTVLPDARQGLAVLLLGLGPLGAAFFLWDAGMKRGDPRLLGVLAYAVPVASTLLLLAAGEGTAGWRVLAAALLVTGGGLLAAWGGGQGRHAAPAAVS